MGHDEVKTFSRRLKSKHQTADLPFAIRKTETEVWAVVHESLIPAGIMHHRHHSPSGPLLRCRKVRSGFWRQRQIGTGLWEIFGN